MPIVVSLLSFGWMDVYFQTCQNITIILSFRCMITGIPFYVAYFAPILAIVFGNLVVLVYVLKSLSKSAQASNKDKSMSLLRQARIAAACSVLMGTTWIIGLFAIDVLTLPMQILFCIFNSLQGMLLKYSTWL